MDLETIKNFLIYKDQNEEEIECFIKEYFDKKGESLEGNDMINWEIDLGIDNEIYIYVEVKIYNRGYVIDIINDCIHFKEFLKWKEELENVKQIINVEKF